MTDDYTGSAQATVVQALYTMDGAPGDVYDPTSAEMVERHAAHILAALDAAGYAVRPAASEPATPALSPSVAVAGPVSCDWCGRGIAQHPDGRWLSMKRDDPYCNERDGHPDGEGSTAHEPAEKANSQHVPTAPEEGRA